MASSLAHTMLCPDFPISICYQGIALKPTWLASLYLPSMKVLCCLLKNMYIQLEGQHINWLNITKSYSDHE